VEQRYGPLVKNWIRGLRRRTSEQLIAKAISIKDAGGKSGGRVSKAVELMAGDLLHVSDSSLRVEQFILVLQQKSAAGVVLTELSKAQTARGSSRTSNFLYADWDGVGPAGKRAGKRPYSLRTQTNP
jgi:hypothetical protein